MKKAAREKQANPQRGAGIKTENQKGAATPETGNGKPGASTTPETSNRTPGAGATPLPDFRNPEAGLLLQPKPAPPPEPEPPPAGTPGFQNVYHVTFQNVENKRVQFSNVGADSDLSIAMACMGAVAVLSPAVAAFRIVRAKDDSVVADCGILDFIAGILPRLQEGFRKPIFSIMNLKPGQKLEDSVEEHFKKRKDKAGG